MASILVDCFGVNLIEAQEIFRNPQFTPLLDEFFKGTGPARIFFYYQLPQKVTESGEVVEYGSHKEFYVTEGEKIKLKGKGVFFVRTTGQGKPINSNGQFDNEVLFGEISEYTVTSLNTVINQIYKPFVERLQTADWGNCESDQRKEFTSVFDKFANELREALKSLQSNVTLESFDRKYENDAKNIHNTKVPNAEMIGHFEKIFNEWSEKIQQHLEEADADKNQERDPGPRQELEYWKQRVRKLTGISEQLRSKNCRTVYDVLTHAA
jgi:dynein heavy chain